MAMNRFACEKYASLEINRAGFLKTGMVVSQTPLSNAFTSNAPCENGMWVDADKANGEIRPLSNNAAANTLVGIVYTSEKEYNPWELGLKNFGRKIEGDYPRVGILGIGDTFTTNCLQYDTTEFANQAALEASLANLATVPHYVTGVNSSPVPKITLNVPAAGVYGSVIKYYTVPNGEKGVKYNIVRA